MAETWRLTSDDGYPATVEVVCLDDGTIVGPSYITKAIDKMVVEGKKLPPAVLADPITVSRDDPLSLAVATRRVIVSVWGSGVWSTWKWKWTGDSYSPNVEEDPGVIY